MSPGGPECVCVIVSREAVLVGGPLWVEPNSSIVVARTAANGATSPFACVPAKARGPPDLAVYGRDGERRVSSAVTAVGERAEILAPALSTQAWTILAYCRVERCGCARKRLGKRYLPFLASTFGSQAWIERGSAR